MKRNRKLTCVALVFTAASLLAIPAMAHNWGCWIQPDRTVRAYNTAANRSQASAALNEWDVDTVLAVPQQGSHTDISVFDGNYGNTGWGGLASIESYSGCTILHGHARLNTYYSYTSNGKRGVFCQEVGHLFGLDHSNDGGCMGGGYFYSIDTYYTVVSHNINDIASKYSGVPLRLEGAALHTEPEDGPRPVVHALWYHHPRSVGEAVRLSSAVVVARVVGVYDSSDLVIKNEGLKNGEDRIPTQRIAFDVDQVLRGSIEPSFDLFRTGNADYVLDGDPPYRMGQTYLLFVTPREDGTYRVISPEGRFQVDREGLLKPASQEEFARVMGGASLESFVRDLAAVPETVSIQ